MERLSLDYPAHCQNGKKKGSCLSSDPEPASPFSLLGMQFSAGSVLPPRDRSLLPLLSCLPFIHATTSEAFPSISKLLEGCSPHLPTPRWPHPVQRPTAPHSPAAAPVKQNLLQDGRRAAWVSKCYHRPSPFPSVRASRPPHQPAGLAEGLLLTADTIGLTVNNKTKSLCTALQTLLHPPGCTAELRDRVGDLCSTLHRVLTGNISFPLTTNTSGNGKKGILPPRETKTMPLSKQKLPGFV